MNEKLIPYHLFTFFLFAVIFASCTKHNQTPANLSITKIEFDLTHEYTYLDLPDGTYTPDNPDFNINNPSTWTGNMAQYVKTNYFYDIELAVINSGGTAAHDAEFDLYTYFNDGTENYEIHSLGYIGGGESRTRSMTEIYTNQEIEELYGEVFWYE